MSYLNDDSDDVEPDVSDTVGSESDGETPIRTADGTPIDDFDDLADAINAKRERELRELCDGDPDRQVQWGSWRGPAWKREGFKHELERRGRSVSSLQDDLMNAMLAGVSFDEFIRLEARRDRLERAKEQERIAMKQAELEKRQQEIAEARNRDDVLLDVADEYADHAEEKAEVALERIDETLQDGKGHVWAASGDVDGEPHPHVAQAADALGCSDDDVIDRLKERNPDVPEWRFVSVAVAEKRDLLPSHMQRRRGRRHQRR